jgi:hypothetical protein
VYSEENGGCPQNEYYTRECCDGVCKDLGFDPDNCGECSRKCSTYANECTDPNAVPTCGAVEVRCNLSGQTAPECCNDIPGCSVFVSPGFCSLQSVCPVDTFCLPTITQEFADRVNATGCESNWKQCLNWDRANPLDPCLPRLGGSLDSVECPLTAQPLQCVEPFPQGHCGSCSTDSDCAEPDVCLSGCGGGSTSLGPFIFCNDPGICARDYEECR